MKFFDRTGRAAGPGETIIGSQETGSHACYLIRGVLAPGEQGRVLRPGAGHEEIVLVVKGTVFLNGAYNGSLQEGQALHLREEESCLAENRSGEQAVYVIAGGHSGQGHH